MSLPKTVVEAMDRGIEFVALNDEPAELDKKIIAGQMSVVALSAAFGYSTRFFARKIIHLRNREVLR